MGDLAWDPDRDGQVGMGSIGDLGDSTQSRLLWPGGVRENAACAGAAADEPRASSQGPTRGSASGFSGASARAVDGDRGPRNRLGANLRAGNSAPAGKQASCGTADEGGLFAARARGVCELQLQLLSNVDAYDVAEALLLPLPRVGRP